jgi:hypothetical protein
MARMVPPCGGPRPTGNGISSDLHQPVVALCLVSSANGRQRSGTSGFIGALVPDPRLLTGRSMAPLAALAAGAALLVGVHFASLRSGMAATLIEMGFNPGRATLIAALMIGAAVAAGVAGVGGNVPWAVCAGTIGGLLNDARARSRTRRSPPCTPATSLASSIRSGGR